MLKGKHGREVFSHLSRPTYQIQSAAVTAGDCPFFQHLKKMFKFPAPAVKNPSIGSTAKARSRARTEQLQNGLVPKQGADHSAVPLDDVSFICNLNVVSLTFTFSFFSVHIAAQPGVDQSVHIYCSAFPSKFMRLDRFLC